MKRILSVICAISFLLISSYVFSAYGESTDVPGQNERVIEPLYEVPDYVQKLLGIAREEIGYTEGKAGRTKYGEWVGDPTCQWCAEFLCWCVDQTDQRYSMELLHNIYPMYGASNVGRNWFISQGRYISRTGSIPDWGSQWYKGQDEMMKKNSYVPQPGDWVFFSILESGDTTHVAMVEYCAKDENGKTFVHVIEGNNPDQVQRNSYALDDWRIQGYGTVFDLADVTLRFGNKGEKVRQMQLKLAALGYMDERYVTGTFGKITQDAVMHFQRDHGIDQTGNGGPVTQRALDEAVKYMDSTDLSVWQVFGDQN